MQSEPEYSGLQIPPSLENIGDKEKELFLRQLAVREQKLVAEWCSFPDLASIPGMLRNETSPLRTFGEAISAFHVFCSKILQTAILLVILPLRKVLMWLQ